MLVVWGFASMDYVLLETASASHFMEIAVVMGQLPVTQPSTFVVTCMETVEARPLPMFIVRVLLGMYM